MKKKPWSKELGEKSGQAPAVWPIGTVAFYGPTNRHASKVAVGIVRREGDAAEMRRWFERNVDVRVDPQIGREVVEHLRRNGVRRTIMARGIIGCPHEEGIDYPEGAECPKCPFWHGRDRFEEAE